MMHIARAGQVRSVVWCGRTAVPDLGLPLWLETTFGSIQITHSLAALIGRY